MATEEQEAEVCTKISDKVKMAGFLEKKGSMLWKRYWFVLEDKLLLFYKSQLEYINLSPCRGSVNMGLVSTVQPRRSSKEYIIHIVSRFNNLILKAKDRGTQEKWMQALLDSIGKQGMNTLKYSLDNLTEDLQTATLPRRTYGGSLDTVWKQPVIPKTKMLDKVLGYDEDPDENQNISDLCISPDREAEVNRKSLTLDNRHRPTTEAKMDSKFGKFRSAISRKKSTASCSERDKVPKARKDSFLRKMFRRTTSSTSAENADPPEPSTSNAERAVTPTEEDVQSVSLGKKTPEVPVTDSDIDDPLYDKIRPSKSNTDDAKNKQMFGRQKLLPAGAMAELQQRLKENNEREVDTKEPPALPPRCPNLEVVEAVMHSKPTDTQNDSEDSELSGNYQVVRNPLIVNKEISGMKEDMSSDSEASGHYQKIRNRSDEALEGVKNMFSTPSPVVTRNESLLWPAMTLQNANIDGEDVPTTKPEAEYQVVNKEMKKKNRLANTEKNDTKIVDDPTQFSPGNVMVVSLYPVEIAATNNAPINQGVDLVDENLLKAAQDNVDATQNTAAPSDNEAENRSSDDIIRTVDEVGLDINSIDNNMVEAVAGTTPQTPDELALSPNVLNKMLHNVAENETKVEPETAEQDLKDAKLQTAMEKEMKDLNNLLGQLAEMTTAPLVVNPMIFTEPPPLSPKIKLAPQIEDPDYDIPRPHVPLMSTDSDATAEDRLPVSDFFNQAECCSTTSNSLEPDSLEEKKETRQASELEQQHIESGLSNK